jgi:hypothetical protein
MKAYVVRNRNGAVTKGWLLRRGTSIDSSLARLPRGPADENIEEVSVETAVRGARAVRPGRRAPRRTQDAPALAALLQPAR